MNRPIRIVTVLCCLGVLAHAGVPQVGLDELERRWKNGGDTTFVVNFWATWCKPCVAELPAFDKLHRSATGKVKVLLVSLDSPADRTTTVQTFVTRRNLSAEVCLLNEPRPHTWIDRVDPNWSGAIPCTLILNAKHNKRAFYEQDFTEADLRRTVEEFLRTCK